MDDFDKYVDEVAADMRADKKYIRNSHLCPQCGSSNISANTPQVEENMIFVGVDCMDCNSGWIDEYNLVKHEMI